jgi:NitT/TauT family transport system substrate-binding protein
MSKVGLTAKDASFIRVGTGPSAVAAMQKGEIDVMSNAEPIISKLEETGDLVVLIDTRTEAGSKALFGGSCPAATLYAPHSYAEKNPEAMQKLVNAFVKTLHWLAKASPEEVADAMPKEYQLGDPGLYRRAVKASLESYSRDGLITEAGQNAVYNMLKAIDPAFKDATIDLKKTFDDRFVKNVKA